MHVELSFFTVNVIGNGNPSSSCRKMSLPVDPDLNPPIEPQVHRVPLPTLALSACMLLATYITYLCYTPPNPNPITTKAASTDRVRLATSRYPILIRRITTLLIGSLHAYFNVLVSSSSPASIPTALCPHLSNLKPSLFTWAPSTSIPLLLILLPGLLRLRSYSSLGPNFTFQLSPPKKLVTTGLYRYIQHPSYTGQILVAIANVVLFERPDGVLGCWIPEGWVRKSWLWVVLLMGLAGMVTLLLGMRIRDEERMLKERFGREWEE